MRSVIIKRIYDNGKETFGELTSGIFNCDTIERAWLNNIRGLSCIPKTEPAKPYICTMTKMHDASLKAGRDIFHYMVKDVPGRSEIFFHGGNYFFNSHGCILTGDASKDINNDGADDLINSSVTVKAFEAFMKGEDFELFII